MQDDKNKEVTNSDSGACTAACTGGPENEHESNLQAPSESGEEKPADPEVVDLLNRLVKLTPEQRWAIRDLLDR